MEEVRGWKRKGAARERLTSLRVLSDLNTSQASNEPGTDPVKTLSL